MLRSLAIDDGRDEAAAKSGDENGAENGPESGAIFADGAAALAPPQLTTADTKLVGGKLFGERHAAILGCAGEPLQQLLLMLDVMGWSAECIETPAMFDDILRNARADADYRLLFIDAKLAKTIGFAIDRARTVVFLGRAPAHGRALYTGKSIIWLQTPLDIMTLERVIEDAA